MRHVRARQMEGRAEAIVLCHEILPWLTAAERLFPPVTDRRGHFCQLLLLVAKQFSKDGMDCLKPSQPHDPFQYRVGRAIRDRSNSNDGASNITKICRSNLCSPLCEICSSSGHGNEQCRERNTDVNAHCIPNGDR